ncbi:MAG TPA: hypothetical protein VKA21_14170, partial [Candidatus Binatia bacterium]|nr:hypothetical protein [Candidatus Binatia bacterium]
ARPGWQLVDPFDPADGALRGNHGGPGDRFVPLVVTGGAEVLRAAPARSAPPELVDVAPTIARLLGLRAPRRLDGSAAPAGAGRVLPVLAHRPH